MVKRAPRAVLYVSVGLGLLMSAVSCSSEQGSRPVSLLTLGIANHTNEYASVARAGDWVAVVWSASSDATGTNVYAAVSRDGGMSFGSPMRVNAVERQANISGEQPPRIALVPRAGTAPDMVVVWTAKLADGTVLLSARSSDGGRSFGNSEVVTGSAAAGNRGWESTAVDVGGHVYTVWLDHRDTATAASGTHAMHQHGATPDKASQMSSDGVARAQRSQLFVGTLEGTVPAQSVTRGVCYCCKTAILTAPEGAVYLAWRHVYPGNYRDIAFTVSRDGGRSFADPARVSEDGWQIDACPENGPSLAADRTGRVHVVWPTLVRGNGTETLKLFASSTADGRTFTPRSALPTSGAAYHPQIVSSPDGSLFAAWDELTPGTPRRIRLARGRIAKDGSVRFESVDLGEDAAGSYPALTLTDTHVVLAWTGRAEANSRIRLRLLPY
jgi:hypothetical protein